MNYLYLIGGLIILIIGGELLVRGAVRIALRMHISTLVVGMTVVSFGTSAPELLVSLESVLRGYPDIALGNVIGSNIANIALVLGMTAMIFPVQVDSNSLRYDWPMMLFSTLLVYLFMYTSVINAWEGAVMLVFLLSFSYFLIWKSRNEHKKRGAQAFNRILLRSSLLKEVIFILVGSVFLAFGAHYLVDGAVGIAREHGVSDFVISVTIVAFGTSVPELITSLIAALKRQTDISIGNLIGSNIFNLLGILGVTALFRPIDINPKVVSYDMLWVIGVAIILYPMMLYKRKILRMSGLLLFLIYVTYIVLNAIQK